MRSVSCLVSFWFVVLGFSALASGHDGRRFEVQVVDNRIVAQGVNTGNDDGAPAIRPYANAVHDHWQNSLVGAESATSTLPGFDIPSSSNALWSQPLYLNLQGVSKWVSPPMMPPVGTVPQLTALGAGVLVEVTINAETHSETTDSDTLGTILLTPSVSIFGTFDIDPLYKINKQPAGEIYVLSTTLSSGNTSVEESDPIYIILSPDGANPAEKLHHASLYLEANITSALFELPADFDQDNDVDGIDFLAWQRNPGLGSLSDWEAHYGMPTSVNTIEVPETATFTLAMMITAFGLTRFRVYPASECRSSAHAVGRGMLR